MAIINGADSLAAIVKAWKMSFWPVMRVSAQYSDALDAVADFAREYAAHLGHLDPLHGRRAKDSGARALGSLVFEVSRRSVHRDGSC